MISTSTPTEHLGRAFGVHRMLDTIGAALGPLIAFGLLLLVPGGYSVVLVVSLAFALAGVALLGLLGPDVRARRDTRRATGADAAAVPVARPDRPRGCARCWRSSGVLGLLTVGDGFIYLALLDHGDFNVTWFPLFYVGTNVAYLLLAVPDRPAGRPRSAGPGSWSWATSRSSAPTCAPSLPTSTAAATVGDAAPARHLLRRDRRRHRRHRRSAGPRAGTHQRHRRRPDRGGAGADVRLGGLRPAVAAARPGSRDDDRRRAPRWRSWSSPPPRGSRASTARRSRT